MTHRDFVYWLQGFFEIRDAGTAPATMPDNSAITAEQVKIVRDHLALVFKHEAGMKPLDPANIPRGYQGDPKLEGLRRLFADPDLGTTLIC